ncbi:MAG TPA: hypothetical protein VG733_08770 [Chthoniobacteraceae bacterium]|nr:hypothetical protein [Chthoniobacteraceae bacterium]
MDWKLGNALLRDRRVPLRYKAVALVFGIAAMAVLELIELPVEDIVALVPFLGILGDLAVGGLEVIFVPLLVACLILPHLAPSFVVEQIRREINGGAPPEGPIIDV